jgi:hypothetical protein
MVLKSAWMAAGQLWKTRGSGRMEMLELTNDPPPSPHPCASAYIIHSRVKPQIIDHLPHDDILVQREIEEL